MRYSKPCLKVEKFTVNHSILADEISTNDYLGPGTGGGFTPYDEDNGTGGGSGGPGFEVVQDAFDILFKD